MPDLEVIVESALDVETPFTFKRDHEPIIGRSELARIIQPSVLKYYEADTISGLSDAELHAEIVDITNKYYRRTSEEIYLRACALRGIVTQEVLSDLIFEALGYRASVILTFIYRPAAVTRVITAIGKIGAQNPYEATKAARRIPRKLKKMLLKKNIQDLSLRHYIRAFAVHYVKLERSP